ncbi:MAG TPA: uridine kinase [Pseudonocardia sp.]|nr:uridine kinase [Pseudonocardia sp.]
MRVRPTRWDAVASELADRVAREFPDRRCRLLLDGPPPTRPIELASTLREELRARGRPSVVVSAADYLRPASVRLEYGHHDPDEFLERWLDVGALRREVLTESGPVLPRLWNAEADRAYRDERVDLSDGGVVLLSGTLLLGRGLPAELTVHLEMSAAALSRHLPAEEHWALPAYARYADENDPTDADLVVLADHPERPAVVVRG